MHDLPHIVASRPTRRITARTMLATGIFCALACAAIAWPIRPPALARDGRALEVFDRSGTRLGTLYARDDRHSVEVPLARVATTFVDAIVATEDRRFFVHGPVDFIALARACAVAVARHRMPGGASTISMQLARLLAPVEPTLAGKLREIVGAARLESGATKRDILEAYVNRIPMGSNLYGVQAAARTYFGVDASDLDLAQAAALAALPNDPVRLDPYRHWSALKARQRRVLASMRATHAIDERAARRAADERLALLPQRPGIVAAPHFLFWLAPQIDARATSVTTTLDLPLQRFVQAQARAVVAALHEHDVRDAAAIVVRNRTGEILAYAGSPDYFADEAFGRNDGVEALRQPGSALKPFLYELALERRIVRPATILQDIPTTYALPDAGLYAPQDYTKSFRGPVRVRAALANSLNVPAVRVLERVGVAAFLDRLHALGFGHLDRSPDFYGLGLTLGGGEVSLYELARAYVALARDGAATRLVATRDGQGASTDVPSANDPSWALVTDMLADAHARAAAFGVDSVLRLPFATAVKTGTSSDFRDTWTVGFSREYTVAVWVGNFDGTPMRDVSGVTGAGPLWNRIMLHLHARDEPRPFAPPRGYVRRPICATTGRPPDRDCDAVVIEALDARDLATYERDARAPRRLLRPLARVVRPHDGDRYAYFPSAGSTQRLAFVFSASNAALRPSLDGSPIAVTGTTYLWPLAPGEHVLRATSDGAPVRFSVVAPPQRRSGFSPRGGTH